jgi:hypothetical protein
VGALAQRDKQYLIPDNHPQKEFLTKGESLCCVIEADTYEEAMQKYHEHMGWEAYKLSP